MVRVEGTPGLLCLLIRLTLTLSRRGEGNLRLPVGEGDRPAPLIIFGEGRTPYVWGLTPSR